MSDQGDRNAGTPRREPTPDEIAVTDVPESVREELTALFGAQSADAPHADEDPTEQSEPSSGGPAPGGEPTRSDPPSATSTSPVPDPTTGDRTTLIVDPLLGGDDGGAEVLIIDDNPDLVVIDADQVDRVVIVDDDRPDPTFEERQRRRKRRERLRRVKWLKLIGLFTGLGFLVLVVLASPLFAVRSVTFEGVVYTSPATVRAVTDLLEGDSVFTVDTRKARLMVLADPWVADVRITTRLSGRALVEVAERKPVVWYAGADQKARVVDARGHVVAVLTGWPTKYLQVRGTGPLLEAGAMADPVYRAAAQLVLALPDELRPKVSALELGTGGELSMILKSGTIVRFGPPTDLQDKLVAVVVLLRRQDPATLAVVDVSTGEPTVQTR